MHALVYFNGQIIDAARARLAAISSALVCGRGVFTTPAIHRGRPLAWPQHWSRLVDHSRQTAIDLSRLDQEIVGAALSELIAANKVKDGRAHVSLLAGRGRGVWHIKGAGAHKTDLLIMTGEPHKASQDGLALTVSPYRTNTLSPLAGIKSISYLEHIISWEEAHARDFDEAVQLNERGEVASATTANLFWVTDGHLHTPALSTGCVSGITRAQVITLAHELAIPIVEGVYELADLGRADEIFLTSSSLGIAIVTTFDFHRYTIPVGSIALRLQEAFRQLTFSTDEAE